MTGRRAQRCPIRGVALRTLVAAAVACSVVAGAPSAAPIGPPSAGAAAVWDDSTAHQPAASPVSKQPALAPSKRAETFAAKMATTFREGSFMKTPFAKDVDPMHPRPEHPKPHMYRPDRWESLNGPWQIEVGSGVEARFGVDLPQDVIVPFPIEAPLSGLGIRSGRFDSMVYRREFVPSLAKPGERLLLHVERVDWHAKVYVNGRFAGEHWGGYGSFVLDITQLTHDPASGATNELIIQVADPTEGGMQPLGKQRADGSSAILYTSVSGIWGDVWLEHVPVAHFTDVWFQTLDGGSKARCHTHGSSTAAGLDYLLHVYDGSSLVANVTGRVGTPLDVTLAAPRPWSPDDPHLYNATLFLAARPAGSNDTRSARVAVSSIASGQASQLPSGVQLDALHTYFGLRHVELRKDSNGRPRILLNGRFTFQVGFLDQGYMPDGIYTYASEAALKHDLAFMKSLGANTIRKHIKVESDRWFLHAAKMGFLVWQDMPCGCGLQVSSSDKTGWDAPQGGRRGCWNPNRTIDGAAKAQWQAELAEIVDQHRYSPSLVQYNVFNEAWGQFDTVEMTKNAMDSLDPGLTPPGHSKQYQYLWSDASGWQDYEVGHVFDLHRYTFKESEFTAKMRSVGDRADAPGYAAERAAVMGEYGGIRKAVAGHLWTEGSAAPPSDAGDGGMPDLTQQSVAQLGWLGKMMLDPEDGLNAGIFTQPFDVEYEINGLQTYDREVTKVDVGAYKAAAEALIEQSSRVKF